MSHQNNKFTLKIYLETADKLIKLDTGKGLTSVEKCILVGFWHNKTYEEIFKLAKHLRHKKKKRKKSYFYLAHHIGPELMNKLSKTLGETVTKKSIRESLKRKREKDIQANLSQDLILIEKPLIEQFIYFLTDTTRNNQHVNFNDIAIEVLRKIWNGKTYSEIASCQKSSRCKDEQCKFKEECVCTYGEDYIRRDVAGKAYKKVSKILKKRVTKENFQDIVKQWQKDQKNFVWKLIQIATSLKTKNLAFAEDRSAKMQRSDFYVLTTLFLLVLVNANTFDANINESTIVSLDFSNDILKSLTPIYRVIA